MPDFDTKRHIIAELTISVSYYVYKLVLESTTCQFYTGCRALLKRGVTKEMQEKMHAYLNLCLSVNVL